MITSIHYESGQENHPISSGRIVLELEHDGSVRLVHERRGTKREWTAQQTSALWPAAATALESAGFPKPPPPGPVPPDTIGFTITCMRDGHRESVALTPSAQYAQVSRLFMAVITQTGGPAVLGFDLPDEPPYVTDAREGVLVPMDLGLVGAEAMDARTVDGYCDWCKSHGKESALLQAQLAAQNPALLARLFDQIIELRPDAISIPLGGSVFLGQIAREQMFERVASDARDEVRGHFFALLGGHRRLVPPGTITIRNAAPETMARILKRGINDQAPKVRERALALAYGLGFVDRVREEVLAHVADPEPDVRQYALVALGVLDDETSRDALVDRLERGSQLEATSAIWALARRRDGVERVLALASDARPWVRSELLGAFAEVSAPLTDAQIDRLRDEIASPGFERSHERHIARTRHGAPEIGPDARFTYSRKSSS
jgi:hypothetical protein